MRVDEEVQFYGMALARRIRKSYFSFGRVAAARLSERVGIEREQCRLARVIADATKPVPQEGLT